MMTKEYNKLRFRMIASIPGQHSFWMELGGYARIAIADQSIVKEDGSYYQPQHADNGLLFVDFHKIAEQDWELRECRLSPASDLCWYLPIVDVDGRQSSVLIDRKEYDWFMKEFG